MKKIITKDNKFLFLLTIFILFVVHLPLFYKNIISADILLNNYLYKGYSWEISLGRFGLYIVGLIKSYLNIPCIDLVISFVIISISSILLIDLFDIKSKLNKTLFILFICVSPVVSATLLFNYCSIGYLISFLCGILSVYIFYKVNNKFSKYLIPIILIVVSLSMYQAYLSLIITFFVIYNIKLLLDNNFKYMEFFKYLICLVIGVILYFITMKLSLYVFHISISNYSNADKIGINTLINIPDKIIDSYKFFYNYYFTDSIMKNTYMHNNYLNLLVFILLVINLFIYFYKSSTDRKNIVIIILLLLLLPIFLNSIIFVINDSKLQLLMSMSYIMVIVLLLSINNFKIKYISLIILIFLLRNYLIQDQATYLSLEHTFNTYYNVIDIALKNDVDNINKKYIIIGEVKNNSDINKRNYGFISDDSIFWDEYNLRKIAFEKFTDEYFGIKLEFGSEYLYNKLLKNSSNDLIYNYDNNIVINLNNYKKNS